jgi:hypothetical protein
LSHYYPDAATLAAAFNGGLTGQNYRARITWPASFGLVGRALDLSYRSNKAAGGGEGYEQDYIHFHDTPVALLAPGGPGLDRWGKYLNPPARGEFAFLGWGLETSYANPQTGEELTLDFSALPQYPYLGADPHKGMIAIVPSWGGDPLVLWGPGLKVEERGIVG